MSISILPYYLVLALTGMIGDYLIYYKKTLYTTMIFVIVGAANFGANFALIPVYGVYGSIWIAFFTQVLVLIIMFIILYKKYMLKFKYWRYTLLVLICANPITIKISSLSISNFSYIFLKLLYIIIILFLIYRFLPRGSFSFRKIKEYIVKRKAINKETQ